MGVELISTLCEFCLSSPSAARVALEVTDANEGAIAAANKAGFVLRREEEKKKKWSILEMVGQLVHGVKKVKLELDLDQMRNKEAES